MMLTATTEIGTDIFGLRISFLDTSGSRSTLWNHGTPEGDVGDAIQIVIEPE